MMFRILATVLCASVVSLTFGQSSSNNAYAITSKTYGAQEWTEVKEINLTNGEVIRNVFENSNLYEVFDGRSLRRLTVSAKADSTKENALHPFSGLSAACAYDAKHNRLYYTPMFINQLRFIDLKSGVPSVYMFVNERLSNAENTEEEASQVTRMVIASDGNGYALDNSSNHLVRFTTSAKPVITELGSLLDAPENGEMSIHDANTSWGGDMLADASGNLYVITAHNHVFKVDIQTRIATYIVKIKGLPVGFTTNGAVVNQEGKVVISSASYLTSYFTVDPFSWEATTVEARKQIYNTSDLANNNLLYKTNFNQTNNILSKQLISVYPNPVKSKIFRVSFDNQLNGRFNVQLVDVTGRTVSDKVVAVDSGSQISEVRINTAITSGMYLVKVLNNRNKEVYTKKIIIE